MKVFLIQLFCTIIILGSENVIRADTNQKVDWSQITPLHVIPSIRENHPINTVENDIKIEGRIVGGFEVEPNSLPYQVGLVIKVDDKRNAWCGGSLISDQYIVTAAHCTEIAKSVTVYLGAHNVRDDNEATQLRIQVPKENLIVHDEWSPTTLSNDIALIKLPEPIEFSETVQSVKLPRKSQQKKNFVGTYVLASGWGKDSDSANAVSPVLRAVRNPVISKLMCSISYFGVISDNHICMSGRGGKSTCNGDSGGPLVAEEENDTKTLLGVTSFGIVFGCEIGWPAVFTRVSSYLDWISENTGIKIEP